MRKLLVERESMRYNAAEMTVAKQTHQLIQQTQSHSIRLSTKKKRIYFFSPGRPFNASFALYKTNKKRFTQKSKYAACQEKTKQRSDTRSEKRSDRNNRANAIRQRFDHPNLKTSTSISSIR